MDCVQRIAEATLGLMVFNLGLFIVLMVSIWRTR